MFPGEDILLSFSHWAAIGQSISMAKLCQDKTYVGRSGKGGPLPKVETHFEGQ